MKHLLISRQPRINPRRAAALGFTLALSTAITACGGGGGDSNQPVVTLPTPTAASTMATLQPAAAMTWETAQPFSLAMTIRHADGSLAAGAAVRVFSLSRRSPQDGSPLDEPVPVNLLDSGATDLAGRLVLSRLMPAHLDEVLVVVTDGASMAQQIASTDRAAELLLTLTR